MLFDRIKEKYNLDVKAINYQKTNKKLIIELNCIVENKEKIKDGILRTLSFINEIEIITDIDTIIKNDIEKESIRPKQEEIKTPRNNTYNFNYKSKKKNVFSKVTGNFEEILNVHPQKDSSTRTNIKGVLSSVQTRETRNQNIEVKLIIVDNTSSIVARFYCTKEEYQEYKSKFIKKNEYAISGYPLRDNYNNSTIFNLVNIEDLGEVKVEEDTYKEKRIELHINTDKTIVDGINGIDEYIDRAKKWDFKTLGICDVDSMHSFIDAYDISEKKEIDIVYGFSGYLYDENKDVIDPEISQKLKDTYIVLDIETTGLRLTKDKIIEIGAVKIKNSTIVEHFSTLVNPEIEIPEVITEITGIRNEDVYNAPTFEMIKDEFLDFIKDYPLVAHNSPFDVPIIKNEFKRVGIEIKNKSIDTLLMSRVLLTKIKQFGLKRVSKFLQIPLENHHRALDDAITCAKIFIHFLNLLNLRGFKRINKLNLLVDKKEFNLNLPAKKLFTALAKSQKGLKNLYKLFSEASIKYVKRGFNSYSKELINKYREGLLIGSSSYDGEVFDALVDGKDVEEFNSFYDYVEISPYETYLDYYSKDQLKGKSDFIELIKELISKINKPIIATSRAKYIDKQEYIYRNIIRFNQKKGYKLEDYSKLYFRTTKEMIDDFSFLTIKEAEKYVIHNPKELIKDFEKIEPFPKKRYPPHIEGSDKQIRELVYDKAHEIYGKNLNEIIKSRIEYELNAIINNGFSVLYMAAQKLVFESIRRGYIVGSRGSVGSSLIATFLDITEVNPLPAHYLCEKCKFIDFEVGKDIDMGFDLKKKNCKNCNIPLKREGYNIPFESFMGFDGTKEPDIDLNFARQIQSDIHKYTEVLFGENYVFKAGTTSGIQDRTAIGYIKNYYESLELDVSQSEIIRLLDGIVGVGRTTGQHPGGIVVIPNDKDVYDFTPLQLPAKNVKSDVITTHFDYDAMKGKLLKLDILGHESPSTIKQLELLTKIDSTKIDIDDEKIMQLFNSTKSLNIVKEGYDQVVATLGIPEFGTKNVRNMLESILPNKISDLIRVSGLSHGENVWQNNAEELVKNNIIDFKDVIATRENIMTRCIQKGIDKSVSFNLMEKVKKKKPFTEEEIQMMKSHGIEDWYIESCSKIKYMFPKAHASAYVIMSLRIAYFKIYYPLEFYATFFSSKVQYFDIEKVKTLDEVLKNMALIEAKPLQSQSDKQQLALYEVVKEMMFRGYEFSNVDIYKSDASEFSIDNNLILPPLQAIPGLGEVVAENIVKAKEDGKFLSIEDLKERSKIGKTSIESLINNGCLEGFSETNQISLFDF